MNTPSNTNRKLIFALAIIITSINVSAQTDWLNWNGVTVSGSLTDRLTARVGHTRAYNMSEKYQNVFNQTQVQLSYELNKQWDIQSGVQFITPTSTKETRRRLFVRAAHTTRLGRKLTWTNSLRVETNSKNENRFRERIIVTTRLGLRKRLEFLRLAPSVSYSLFYNIGGNPIRYYDENAVEIARQTPDGFHRSRLTINFNSKINPYLSVSLYYMRQQEFNLLASDTRKMNVFDPTRNRILRPFNNYNTLGITMLVNLDPLFKK